MFDLDSAIGFVVNRTAYMMRRAALEEFRKHGQDVTPEEWAVLARLWQQDRRRPAELADLTVRDRTTVTRLLDRLEDKDLIRREVDPEDRRSFLVWLTGAGRALEEEVVPVVRHLLDVMTREVAEEELEITVDTLLRIQETLIAYTEDGSQ